MKMKRIRTLPAARIIGPAACFLFITALPSSGEQPEGEILNRLYEEIIGSSRTARVMSMDSIRPYTGPGRNQQEFRSSADAVSDMADPDGERLNDEINKMIRDAQTRHSDAVKFMLDGR